MFSLKDNSKVLESKILVIGAGGIGCELLKALVLSGFRDIVIIDLDTIEVTNLNRQLLFSRSDVGKSKAQTAKNRLQIINPDSKIIAFHNDVTKPEFGIDFYRQFDIVLNALDNIPARSHVNKMCLAADVTLIESGTSGFQGQVHVIKKGFSRCYDCDVHPKPVSYPICTIRNTPSKMIHCIVWAKNLYEQIFTPQSIDDLAQDLDDEFHHNFLYSIYGPESLDPIDRIYDLFIKIFYDDILQLGQLVELWQNGRPRPKPIDGGIILKNDFLQFDHDTSHFKLTDSTTDFFSKIRSKSKIYSEFELFDINDYMLLYIFILEKLLNRSYDSNNPKKFSPIKWDKDDSDVILFTAIVSNIRAFIFSIPFETFFKIKSMAGNIIPAIATTNAKVAGLIIAECFKVLSGSIKKCHSVYISKKPNFKGQVLVPCIVESPNPNCYACKPIPNIIVTTDTFVTSLLQFRNDCLVKTCNILSPDVVDQRTGTIIISSDEDDMLHIDMNKPLNDFGIIDGSQLKVEDFDSDHKINIFIRHKTNLPNSKMDINFLQMKNDSIKLDINELHCHECSNNSISLNNNFNFENQDLSTDHNCRLQLKFGSLSLNCPQDIKDDNKKLIDPTIDVPFIIEPCSLHSNDLEYIYVPCRKMEPDFGKAEKRTKSPDIIENKLFKSHDDSLISSDIEIIDEDVVLI